MQTDATLSEDDTDWEDDGIPGLPKDPVIFEYFSNVLQSKDLKVNDSLISPILDPFKELSLNASWKTSGKYSTNNGLKPYENVQGHCAQQIRPYLASFLGW